MRELVWQTAKSLDECLATLARSSEADSIFRSLRFDSKGTIYSSVHGTSFRLFAKGRAFVRNSWEPYFYGSLLMTGSKTEVRGRFRIHPFVVGFMAIWFTGVVLVGGIITIAAIAQLLTGRRLLEGHLNPGVAAMIGPAMLGFGIGLQKCGWWFGRNQRDRIEGFIETTFEAHRLT